MALGPIFLPNLPPKIHQNPLKIDAKRRSNLDFNFWSIFDRIWLPTSTPITSKKHCFFVCFSTLFAKSAFRSWDRFWIRFGCQLAPIFPPKIHQNSIFNGIKKLCDLGIDFYAFLGPTWSHLGLQLGPILVPRSPPKSPPKTHLGARTRPDPQNDSKMEPPTLQNEAPDPPFWIAFDVNFGYMLMICSLLFLFIFGIDFGVDYTG
jgi:hypothetical protein